MFISLYTIILAFSAFITGMISVFILMYRRSRASYEFGFLLLAMTWWSAMICLESVFNILTLKIFFTTASYPGSQFAPVLFLLFALRYTQMDAGLSLKKKAALFILPCISLLIAITNPLHHFLWADISLAESAFAGSYVLYTHGPWYWVEIIYSYSLLTAGVGALILASIKYPLVNSVQYLWILGASMVSFLGNAVYAFFFSFVQGIDPTPLLLSISTILIAIGLNRFRILDIIPIAREQILECMKEGMITIDKQSRVIDYNPSAALMLNLPGSVGGRRITDILPWWPSMNTVIDERSGVLPHQVDNSIRYLAWSASEIIDSEDKQVGVNLLIQDVTTNYEMENQLRSQSTHLEKMAQSLSAANTSLQLMTSITRHDILNMITVQRGYMEIALADKTINSYEQAIEKSYPAVLKIQKLIEFTQEYQEIGTSIPVWRPIGALIQKVSGIFRESRGVISMSIPDSVEVYVDSLFEKVIFILIDNALRHGKTVNRIHFSCTLRSDCIVICEDNGVGVLPNEKEEIFHRGVGKNSGLGLYLAREILKMNNSSICETGYQGSGARFELCLPPDRWREKTLE